MPKPSAVGMQPSFEIVEWLTGDECHELEDAAMAASVSGCDGRDYRSIA
jgi:hypothetical protein